VFLEGRQFAKIEGEEYENHRKKNNCSNYRGLSVLQSGSDQHFHPIAGYRR
jgi:hypothetical protein